MHEAEKRAPGFNNTDKRCPDRQAKNECTRAVYGIEDPDAFSIGAFIAILLADNSVSRKTMPNDMADCGFGGTVRLGNGVETGLGLVLDGECAPEVRQDGVTGRGCHFKRGVAQNFHVG